MRATPVLPCSNELGLELGLGLGRRRGEGFGEEGREGEKGTWDCLITGLLLLLRMLLSSGGVVLPISHTPSKPYHFPFFLLLLLLLLSLLLIQLLILTPH